MLSVVYAECHYAQYHYAEYHYAQYHYAECHYAQCHYAECLGTYISYCVDVKLVCLLLFVTFILV